MTSAKRNPLLLPVGFAVAGHALTVVRFATLAISRGRRIAIGRDGGPPSVIQEASLMQNSATQFGRSRSCVAEAGRFLAPPLDSVSCVARNWHLRIVPMAMAKQVFIKLDRHCSTTSSVTALEFAIHSLGWPVI